MSGKLRYIVVSFGLATVSLVGLTARGQDAGAAAPAVSTATDHAAEREAPPENAERMSGVPEDATRPNILGMTVIEHRAGRAEVVDVGAATPAWEAGIRKGDFIASLHGVKVDKFADWVDNVRKVVADAKSGQSIPLEIVREDKPLDIQLKIPDRQPVPRTIAASRNAQTVNQTPIVAAPATGGAGAVPVPVGGGSIGVGVPFGGGFDDEAGGTAASDRMLLTASAQLVATGNLVTNGAQPATTTSRVAPFPGGAAAGAGGGQVGIAQFADSGGGMMARVQLAGLPPGTYQIGIGDASGINPGGVHGVNGVNGAVPQSGTLPETADSHRNRVGARNSLRNPPNSTPVPGPGVQPPNPRNPAIGPNQNMPGGTGNGVPNANPGAGGTPGAGARGTGGGGSGGGASTGSGASTTVVPRDVLAQVMPEQIAQAATGGAAGVGANNTGSTAAGANNTGRAATPASNGATLQAGPQSASPTGQAPLQPGQVPGPPGQLTPGSGELPNGRAPDINNGPIAGQGWIQLGVIHVRPNGGGQLQQRIEGVRVASIVGQSVLVVGQNSAGGGGAAAAARANQATGRGQAAPDARAGLENQFLNSQGGGASGVVASGVIQATSSGGTGSTGVGAAGSVNGGTTNAGESARASGSAAQRSAPPTGR